MFDDVKVPSFPDDVAMALIEEELGQPWHELYSELSPSPIAAGRLNCNYLPYDEILSSVNEKSVPLYNNFQKVCGVKIFTPVDYGSIIRTGI